VSWGTSSRSTSLFTFSLYKTSFTIVSLCFRAGWWVWNHVGILLDSWVKVLRMMSSSRHYDLPAVICIWATVICIWL
jgi:hypothetical protein